MAGRFRKKNLRKVKKKLYECEGCKVQIEAPAKTVFIITRSKKV